MERYNRQDDKQPVAYIDETKSSTINTAEQEAKLEQAKKSEAIKTENRKISEDSTAESSAGGGSIRHRHRGSNMAVRVPVYIIGLFIMTLGVGISVKSDLGVSPVSSIPYTMTCVWGIEMGKATIIFHAALVVLQVILLRRRFKIKNLLQVPVGVMFGYFTTFSNYLMSFFPDPGHIAVQLGMLLISTTLIAFGLFLYVPADIIPLAGEGAMLAIADVVKKQFSTIKLMFDISMVMISLAVCLILLHSLGSVGIGTVIAAVLVGVELKLITRLLGNLRDRKLHFGKSSCKSEASDQEENPLADIMKSDVYTISGEAKLSDVLQLITEKGVSGVPVVNDAGGLIGFVSDGDILRFLASEHPLYVNPSSLIEIGFDDRIRDLMTCKVRDIARKRVITVDLEYELGRVCQVLAENHIKKAPVMSGGHMVGIINASNITKYAFRQIEGEM